MNIFLVEDERWALAELVELCKVYESRHSIYAFENGEDALAAAGRNAPQLVLTDINMPGMDGLELIGKLMQLDPTVKVVILSVHDKFEYARQGMKAGAVDYLLKPVRKDILLKTIDSTVQSIESENRQKQKVTNWSITRLLFSSELPDNETSNVFFQRKYLMALLLAGNWASPKGWRDCGITDDDIQTALASKGRPACEMHCLDIDLQRKVILIPAEDDGSAADIKTNMHELFEYLNMRRFVFHLSYGIKNEQEAVHTTFSLLNKRMEENMKLGISTFIPPQMKSSDADISEIWEMVRLVERHFKNGDIRKGKETIYQLLQHMEKKEITVKQLKLFINDLLFSLKYKLQASNNGLNKLNKMQDDFKNLDEFSSYGQLADWLHGKILSLFSDHAAKDTHPKELVPVILHWIHSHYQSNISLQQFAAEHHVSLGYLSRLFKSQCGCTFSDYLSRYRIGKAKELLAGGVERLSDVSSLVGYEDSKHFSALFKRIMGETPNSYSRKRPLN